MQVDPAADIMLAGAPPTDVSNSAGETAVTRWLPAARVTWLVVALGSLAQFILTEVPYYRQLMEVSAAARRSLARASLTPQVYALAHVGLDVLFVAVFTIVGWLIYLRRPNGPMALLTALALVVWGSNNGSLVGGGSDSHTHAYFLIYVLAGLAGILAYGSWVLFFYLFPSGRFVPRWTRFSFVAWVITAFLWASPIGPPAWPAVLDHAYTMVLWSTFPVSQIYRYVRVSMPIQRLQTKWVVFGIAIGVIGYQLAQLPFLPLTGVQGSNAIAQLVVSGLQHLFVAFVPITIGIAILRYRLFDIDLIINRTLVYGGLTVLVVGGYVLIVGYLGAVFQAHGGLALSLVATGVVAVLFQPARQYLQQGVNRLLYGDRDDPYAAITRLGRQLEGALAADAILPTVATTIRESLKLPYAAITLPGNTEPATEVGQPKGTLLRVPLIHAGEPVGELVLGQRVRGEGWTSAEQRLLDDLAHSAGAAVQSVRLARQLQHSREQLVLAREEERRRLRRDLHDDLAPSLAALALTASTVADLIPIEAVEARRRVEELRRALRSSVGEVRRIAHDLRPPTLDELGLVAAVQERTEQYAVAHGAGGNSNSTLQVTVDTPHHLPPLTAAAEVAAYRIIQEALMNVVRHAGAQHCRIRLASEPSDTGTMLEVSVMDDGVGLPDRDGMAATGVGLRSMRERAMELGGSWSIERLPGGGTCVRAYLPAGTTNEEEPNGPVTRPDR